MNMEFETKVGRNLVKFSDTLANEKEFFAKTQFYFDLPDECGHCQSEDLVPNFRQPKGYEYYSVDCKKCGWSLKFGQYRDKPGLFPKEWEAPMRNDEQAKRNTR